MIECKNLRKTFKSHKKEPGVMGALKSFVSRDYVSKDAVRDFSMLIDSGEFIGLLGPNGAGKTTLMKMLTGIIVPTSGEAEVLGFVPSERKIDFRKDIALVMGQKSQLWWDIPAMDSFLLLQKYYEVSDQDFKTRLDELSELLGVKELLHIQVRRLSLGERMKLELIACLLHQPKVIFLDEPTIGLDVVAQTNIRKFLKDYHKKYKTTIVLTSHYMADIEALCSRIVLILDGQKSFDGSIDEFQNILGKEKFVTFRFEDPVDSEPDYISRLHPTWNEDRTQVEVRIPENELRITSAEILQRLNVSDFYSEKMPVERVMSTLLTNPNILCDTYSEATSDHNC